jgi:hypothetical protein
MGGRFIALAVVSTKDHTKVIYSVNIEKLIRNTLTVLLCLFSLTAIGSVVYMKRDAFWRKQYLYVADWNNSRIQKLVDGRYSSSFGTNGPGNG